MLRTLEEQKLDSTPLSFGKHKGFSPDAIAEMDPQYIVWGYGNITNRPFCSFALASKCGYVDMSGRDPSARDLPLADRNELNRESPYRVKDAHHGFDDMDDDILF